MVRETDDEPYHRRRRDPRQCKLAPDENSFNFRKSRMKARVQKEKKFRDARAAIEARKAAEEARKRRSSSRRNHHSDDEIEESGTTEDFLTSQDSNSNEGQDRTTAMVPFAAAEPLPNPNDPSNDRNASDINTAPNGTVSASSAEVLSGSGRPRESNSSGSSEDENEDASVLSLGAEATPIHDTNQQSDPDENQEPRERQRRQSSSERKNRQSCFSRKCKIITFVIFVVLFGGAGAFFAIRGFPTNNLSIPVKQISVPPTFAPTSKESLPNTNPPTQELLHDAPSPEECEIIRNGGHLEGEEGLLVSRYNVELDVELTSGTTVEEAINAISNATQKILIPDLVGCFGAQRNLMGHYPLRGNHAKRTIRYNPHRYAVANGNFNIRLAEARSCDGIHVGPCLGIDVILHLAAKNENEKQFVFQSLIIEIFGPDDLATSLNLDAFLASIKLIDVKINVETDAPSGFPSNLPTHSPSEQPSDLPSLVPSKVPTKVPSYSPTALPSLDPTIPPSLSPSQPPTVTPTTGMPTIDPSARPSGTPTQSPLVSVNPTASPTVSPSHRPTSTFKPTVSPTVTQVPTLTPMPTRKPTVTPSEEPTRKPTLTSSEEPTGAELGSESVALPTEEPTSSLPIDILRNPTSSPLEVVVDFAPP